MEQRALIGRNTGWMYRFFSLFRSKATTLNLFLLLQLSSLPLLLQALRLSAAAPPAALAASVAAVAESARTSLLSALAAVLPEALSRQLAAQLSPAVSLAISVLAAVAAFLLVKKVFDTPSRKYDPANPNVGDEYDAWTR
jgi:hypothetical protein